MYRTQEGCPEARLVPTRARNPRQRPLLRWAGGKRQLLPQLLSALPPNIRALRYHEPFFGAGALYFALTPRRAFLSDANPHLMGFYSQLVSNPRAIHRYLSTYVRSTSEAYYYRVRAQYNRSRPSAAQAARFLYLNRTCFNGIFRVNRRGSFNVPYGWKEPPPVPSLDEILHASSLMRTGTLAVSDYRLALSHLGPGDFVYLDPPYPALSATSFFAHYTSDRFSDFQQTALAGLVQSMARKGVAVLLTNADTSFIRRLYRGLHVRSTRLTRVISCKHVRHSVRELIITSYGAPGL